MGSDLIEACFFYTKIGTFTVHKKTGLLYIFLLQTTVRRLTASERERQLQNFRRQEEVREDTLRQLGTQKLLEANMSNEERLSEKRYIRRMMMEQKEREMEDTILKVSKYI